MFGLQEGLFSVNFTAFRIVRVARLLRMINTSRELQMLLKTLYLAFANILNVCLLFLLVIFTFTIAGMDLFGDIEEGAEKYISSESNFRTFYSGMMLLVRTSTGESWNGVMHDTAAKRPILATFYWITFTFCGFFIYVNVLIAVIFEEYCNANYKGDDLERQTITLKQKDIDAFLRTWAIYDPLGNREMPTHKFPEFLMKLPQPMGFEDTKMSLMQLKKVIYCLNIRDHEGIIYFPEVMWTVFYSVVGFNDSNKKRL